jgi:hypothetical protein
MNLNLALVKPGLIYQLQKRQESAQHMQREFVTHRNTVDTIDIPWSSSKKSMDCKVKRTAVAMTALDFA